MSMTKRSDAYRQWAEEDRYGGGMRPDHSYQLFLERQYLEERTAAQRKAERERFPASDEQPEQPEQRKPLNNR